MPSLAQLWKLGSDKLGVGLGLPLDDFEKARKIISEGLDLYRAKQGRGFFFTSFGPVTRDVNLDTLHELVKEIAKVSL
jgi:hypothetical protein